jgi:hypothetical protein
MICGHWLKVMSIKWLQIKESMANVYISLSKSRVQYETEADHCKRLWLTFTL